MEPKQFVAGRVTIGIPTYKRPELVLRAIRRALDQTYRDIEVIVSDNASNDGTAAQIQAISDPRLKLIQQTTNIGLGGNFNACLHAATGELFLLCPDDDQLEPTAIEKLSKPFFSADGKSVGLTWCPCLSIDDAGKTLWVTEAGPAQESSVSFLVNLYTGHRGYRYCGALYRTADAIAVGGMNEARYGVLFDTGNLGLIALLHDTVVCVNEPLARYAMHSQGATKQAQCQQWQTWGRIMIDDHIAAVTALRDTKGARALKRAHNCLLANLTVDVLMRSKGSKGWIPRVLEEFWKGRQFMLTLYVAKRILKDGWKLLRD
jgi:glycosyltransferase involved in cell wall biosynthesis